MNTRFKSELLRLISQKSSKGFTLIELLVVVIIIGILAAVALPNLLGQVAKGRQSEAKNNLGAINRAQQAYRLEKARFAPLSSLPITVTGQYYDYTDENFPPGTPSATLAKADATAKTLYDDDIKDYEAAIYQGPDGTLNIIICESVAPDGPGGGGVGTNSTADSCNVGVPLN